MQRIIDFAVKDKNTKGIVLLIENENSLEEIKPLFYLHHFENVYIYSSKKEIIKAAKKIWKGISKEENFIMPELTLNVCDADYMNISDELNDIDILFFDSSVPLKVIRAMTQYSPRVVIGRVWEAKDWAYSIWEYYRSISKKMCIQNIRKNRNIEVLHWEKRESDIELSIVFPVYKIEKYLDKCIESVTAWKAPYVEFLFVDDGSPDNSAKILEEYQKNYKRIKIIHKENGGCASARKKGLEMAQGRYVGFFDPDDFVDESMYYKLLSRAMVGGYDIAYCGYNKYYENSNNVEKVTDAIFEPYSNGVCDEHLIKQLICAARVAIWRGIYRKEFLNKNKISFYEDIRRFDDLPFKVETFAKAKSVVAVPEHLYYYRLERPGQDVACDDERLYVHFSIFKHLDESVGTSKDRKLIDYLQVVKAQTHLYAIEKIQKKYLKEYVRQMKADLKQDAGFYRTILLIRKHAEKKYVWPYIYCSKNMIGMLKRWLRTQEKNEKKVLKNNTKIMHELRSMYR